MSHTQYNKIQVPIYYLIQVPMKFLALHTVETGRCYSIATILEAYVQRAATKFSPPNI